MPVSVHAPSRWLTRFHPDGDSPAVVARELLDDVLESIDGGDEPDRLRDSAAAVAILRVSQGRSAACLVEDVLGLRRAVWEQLGTHDRDAGVLLLTHQRVAEVLDTALLYAVEAYVEESQRALSLRATRDALTGLLNRAAFDEALAHECALSERDEPPALLLIDLDGFKGVNDTLGHAAGDDILITVAQLLTRVVRRSDLVARLGGDEFAVLLPRTGSDRALDRADKLLTSAARSRLLHPPGAPTRIGLSIGVARLDSPEPEVLLATADAAMYASKRAGKGCSTLGTRAVLAGSA